MSHYCTDAGNGHYSWCDGDGTCAVDFISDFPANEKQYGPGSEYTINTLLEFHVEVDFIDVNEEFYEYVVVLS